MFTLIDALASCTCAPRLFSLKNGNAALFYRNTQQALNTCPTHMPTAAGWANSHSHHMFFYSIPPHNIEDNPPQETAGRLRPMRPCKKNPAPRAVVSITQPRSIHTYQHTRLLNPTPT